MKELKDYTSNELRAELKRRSIEARKSHPRVIEYKEFEGIVSKVENQSHYMSGKTISFVWWKFVLKDITSKIAVDSYTDTFYLKQGLFKKADAPKIGDRVRLRYRRTKGHEVFDVKNAKIVEIIKESDV